MAMPHKGQKTTVKEDGQEKEAYQITFTNGALEELEDIAKSLNTADDLDTAVRVAIAYLKNTLEKNNKHKLDVS
jgi:cation transport regulator ChaB